ncbi:SagB/ThcOx family dehydrogenase [bacterium]|nr:SagB/ThcOx family dehydrogenase [bacterium]
MLKKIFVLLFVLIIIAIVIFIFVKARYGYKLKKGDIKLERTTDSEASLMDALQNRRSNRKFSTTPLSNDVIANLLWSANGVNDKDGRRTAPTARNKQEMELYVILPTGAYIYMPKENVLNMITEEDLTSKTGYNAPMTIVYVADTTKQEKEWAYTDMGFIGQNVYLFCAVNGLNTVFKGSFDDNYLREALKVPDHKQILAIQDVGYPVEE